MSESETSLSPMVGHIVFITKGREAGQFAVVINQVDEYFVLIADGGKRTFARPKKKSIQHLKFYNYVSSEVYSSIEKAGRVTNKKLRYTLKSFVDEVLGVPRKGV